MIKKPDYEYLLKLDKWSKKDAALIISGFNPEQFRDFQFSAKNISEELREPYKIYQILLSINFSQKYGGDEKLPRWYIHECLERNISLPEELKISFKKFIAYQAKIHEIFSSSGNKVDSTNNQNIRERKYLLKIIGAIVSMYFTKKQKGRASVTDKIVISEVVEDIMQYLEDHDLKSPGLGKSNLHQKISEGIEQFLEEFV